MTEEFLQSFWIVIGIVFVSYAVIRIGFYFLWNSWRRSYPGLGRESIVPSLWIALLRIVLLGSALCISYLAFRPYEGPRLKEEEASQGVDFLFLVDTSLSMQATDTAPTRMARVKETILRILPGLSGNRFGMIVFAGSPFLYCPMTSDIGAFSDYVRGLDVDIVGDRGTDLAAAFQKAEDLLKSNRVFRNRILVLISDGEDVQSPGTFSFPADVWVWSVGTPTGGSIAYTDDGSNLSGYLTKDGSLAPYENSPGVVVSKANLPFLKSIAEENGGRFLDLDRESPNPKEIRSWLESMDKNTNKRIRNLRRAEGYRKYLLPVVLLLLFDFIFLEFIGKYLNSSRRRNLSAAILLFGIFFFHKEASAVELDPGGNRIQEGRNSYESGDYQGALEKYKEAEPYFPEDPRLDFNRGSSKYKSGDLDGAIRHFEKSADSKDPKVRAMSHFNLGNAYLKLGDRKKAAEHYLRSLKEDPNLESARKNLEWLRKMPPPQNGKTPQENEKSESGKGEQIKPGLSTEDRNSSRKGEKGQVGKDSKSKNKSKAEEELDRIMESMDLDSVRRKSPGSRSREVFW